MGEPEHRDHRRIVPNDRYVDDLNIEEALRGLFATYRNDLVAQGRVRCQTGSMLHVAARMLDMPLEPLVLTDEDFDEQRGHEARRLVPDAELVQQLRDAAERADWRSVTAVREALDERADYVAEERVCTTDRMWRWLYQNGYPDAAKASFEVRELFFYPETSDTDRKLSASPEQDVPITALKVEHDPSKALGEALESDVVPTSATTTTTTTASDGPVLAALRSYRKMVEQADAPMGALMAGWANVCGALDALPAPEPRGYRRERPEGT